MKLFDVNSNQGIDFQIPEKYNNIAVNCSGGADSSIMLYMTIKYLEDNNRHNVKVSILTCANDFKGRWNARNAANIINYVIEKTNTSLIDHHYAYYRDKQDVKYFHEVEYKLFEDKKIDLVISGITSNPKINTTVYDINNNLIDLKDDALDVRNGDNHNEWILHEKASWYQPFINVDKRFTAYLYKHFDVEDLLNLTRSCEAVNNEDTNNYTEPCGKCWWCLERKWAFGRF